MVGGMVDVLPLVTLALGFVASFLLELFRNRWTTQNAQDVHHAERRQIAHLERLAFEREGLRAVHACIHDLLSKVNAIALPQAKAEAAGLDWRESDEGQELRAAAMHATVRCSHESALLLHPPLIEAVDRLTTAAYPMYWTRESGSDPSHRREFFEASQVASRALPPASASSMASRRTGDPAFPTRPISVRRMGSEALSHTAAYGGSPGISTSLCGIATCRRLGFSRSAHFVGWPY
jgi:hypothetical protein